jgi:hypothetical protein
MNMTTTNKNNITLTTKNGVYLLLLAISGSPTPSLFGKFLRRTIIANHMCPQNLLYLVQSRDTETRAFVLRLFINIEGEEGRIEGGEGDRMEVDKTEQSLGEKFWKVERISFVVNALKDTRIQIPYSSFSSSPLPLLSFTLSLFLPLTILPFFL